MIKYGLLEDTSKWKKRDRRDFFSKLSVADQELLVRLKKNFGEIKGKDLVRYVYLDYPYYAINSKVIEEILTTQELREIYKQVPSQTEKELFTIGYEGRSIEEFLNLLIKNNVRLLCDVRKNPVSMKFGFSKNQLSGALEKLHIEYRHFPQLGIISSKREKLDSIESYEKLFKNYEKNELTQKTEYLDLIYQLLVTKNRIAITCFEKSPEFCHRGIIAKAMSKMPQWKYRIIHL